MYTLPRLIGTLATAALLVLPISLFADSEGIQISPALFEERVDAGKTYDFSLKVRNTSALDKTYYLSVKDIKSVDNAGRPTFAEAGEPTDYDLSGWVTLKTESVTLTPGATETVDFTVAIPSDATPGSHFGGVFLTTEPPRLREIGTAVGVSVGSLLSLRISGEAIENARLREFSTTKLIYNGLPIAFDTGMENLGNTLLRPTGFIEIVNMFGTEVANLKVNESNAGLFPKAERAFNVVWESDDFQFGRYQAVLSLVYGDDVRKTVSATTSFWVLPLKPIAGVLGSILGVLLVLYILVKVYIARTLSAMGVSREARAARKYERSMSKTMFTIVVLLIFCALFLGGLFLMFA